VSSLNAIYTAYTHDGSLTTPSFGAEETLNICQTLRIVIVLMATHNPFIAVDLGQVPVGPGGVRRA
jgi:hypothetical protein